jgi:hypothetical protein
MDLTPTHMAILAILNNEQRLPSASELGLIAYELQKEGLVAPSGCCHTILTPEGQRRLEEAWPSQ